MKKRIEELLELVNLPGFGERYHDQLSGEQQRTTLEGGQVQPVLAYTHFQSQLNQQVWLELPPERCQIVPE